MIKGCSVFRFDISGNLNGDFISLLPGGIEGVIYSYQLLEQFSENPTVYTRLGCYLSWIAKQYGMTYIATEQEERCEKGVGVVGGEEEKCRTTPTFIRDREERIEAECIFPYYIDEKEDKECTLNGISDFTRPQFICPIRTIKGKGNKYLTKDIDAKYCPTTNNMEVDDNCSSLLDARPVFATCKNTCPGGESEWLLINTKMYWSYF